MTTDDRSLRIAIPSKGRLHDRAAALLREAGLSFRRRDRRLHSSVKGFDATVIFANAGDIPTLIAEGAVDLGISGQDLVRERGGDRVKEQLLLGFGRCRICVAVREADGISDVAELAGRSIGTSFPWHAERFLAERQIDARLIQLKGSLEVMVALGLVDAIVELVETGDSLRDNHLVPIAEIATSEAVLISHVEPAHGLVPTVVRRVEGVLIAQRYVICEYNLPEGRLTEAREVTPGFNAPTVQQTGDAGTLAIKVMVPAAEIAVVMDRLEAIGATAILVSTISNCRL